LIGHHPDPFFADKGFEVDGYRIDAFEAHIGLDLPSGRGDMMDFYPRPDVFVDFSLSSG
jgi:hypothetical protein